MNKFVWIWLLFIATAAYGRTLDINAMIERDCGPIGFHSDSGCTITLPKGEFEITETVQVGRCEVKLARPSVTIQGQGPGGVTSMAEAFGGTSLVWAGPPGGTMVKACGAPDFTLSNLSLVLDPNKKGGVGMAQYGVVLSADNSRSATTQNPRLVNVSIVGSVFTPNSAIGVWITGENNRDETDRVSIVDSDITHIGTAILQDSQQSVLGRVENSNLIAHQNSVVVMRGGITIENCSLGNYPSVNIDYVAVNLLPWGTVGFYHNVHILGNHFEVFRGKFINAAASSSFALNIWRNKFQLACSGPNCELFVLDSINKGPVVMIGNTYDAAIHSDQVARIRQLGEGELIMIGNYKRPNLDGLTITTP